MPNLTAVPYLRIIITKQCNLNCPYCHREGEASGNDGEPTLQEYQQVLPKLLKMGFRKIKLLGGEPTLHPQLESLVCLIRQILPEADISMISNGSFDKHLVPQLRSHGIDRINISLHGDPEEAVQLPLIHYIHSVGMLSKLNFVIRRNQNESQLWRLIDSPWMPRKVLDVLNMLYGPDDENWAAALSYSFEELEFLIGSRFRIKRKFQAENLHNLPSTRLELENGVMINLKTSRLGRILPFRCCSDCHVAAYCTEGISAIRLTTDMVLRPCLYRTDNTLEIRPLLRQGNSALCDQIIADYLESL